MHRKLVVFERSERTDIYSRPKDSQTHKLTRSSVTILHTRLSGEEIKSRDITEHARLWGELIRNSMSRLLCATQSGINTRNKSM